jgi:hypothetical protein
MAVIHRFFTCKIIVTHPVGKAINEMNTKTQRESLGRFCSPANEGKIGQEEKDKKQNYLCNASWGQNNKKE